MIETGFELKGSYHKVAKNETPGKIVTVGALLVNGRGEFLALKSSDEQFAGMTGIPRGRVLPKETVRNALLREVKEETGIHIFLRERLRITETDTHIHHDFIAQVRIPFQVRLSAEHTGYFWAKSLSLEDWKGPKEPLVQSLIYSEAERKKIDRFVNKIVKEFKQDPANRHLLLT